MSDQLHTTILEMQAASMRRRAPAVSHRVECFDAAGSLVFGTPARGRRATIEEVGYRLCLWIGATAYQLRRLHDDKVLDRTAVR